MDHNHNYSASCIQKLEDVFRKLDLFGTDVNMSIGHEKVHRSNYLTTKFGGCVSIVFAIGMLYIAGGEAMIVQEKLFPHYSISEI